MKTFLLLALFTIVFSCGKNLDSDTSQKGDTLGTPVTQIPADTLVPGTKSKDVIINGINLTQLRNESGEYSSFLITFSLETPEETINGYSSLFANYFELDSLIKPEYLKVALSEKSGVSTDSLVYSKYKIRYEYNKCHDNLSGNPESRKRDLYYLRGRKVISMSIVKELKISNIEVTNNIFGFGKELTLEDTTWIKDEPLRCVNVPGYLCSHDIFVYQDSKLVTDVINRIIKTLSKYEVIDSENGDEVNKKVNEALIKIHKEKIVIISKCTC